MTSHHACGMLVFLSVFLISYTLQCNGGSILVVPLDGSHWLNMKILLEELHARGHNLTVIRTSRSWYISEKSDLYTSITIEMALDYEQLLDVFLQEEVCYNFLSCTGLISMLSRGHSLWYDAIKHIFDDQNMLKRLRDSQHDLALADPTLAPGLILTKYLKLPLVLNVRWITNGEGHFVLAPSPFSYIPVLRSGLTDKMNFFYDDMCDKYIEGGCDVISLLQEADIWLFRSDFVFEFPRPTMPNVVYIGGFQCKPAQGFVSHPGNMSHLIVRQMC
uniref:UDP glucuronosyltransferase 5 family, polypeptide D1 n=1 Tax=Neolamprologus brichardi TaxID=32507 RepID=A0A3Q4H861_NEOBR